MRFKRYAACLLGVGGLSAPISFKKGVKHSNSCFFLMGIKNQKFVSLKNSKPVCVH